MKFFSVYVILLKKEQFQDILPNMWPGNKFNWKMEFLIHADYIGYAITDYQTMLKSACRLPGIPFHRGFLKNESGPKISFQVTFFVELFDENFLLHCYINLSI